MKCIQWSAYLVMLTVSLMKATAPSLTQDPQAIDFDVSMGKSEPFFRNHYSKLLQVLPQTYNKRWFRYIHPHIKVGELYEQLKAAYQKNGLLESSSVRIPRIFHQIWIGPNPFPEKYKRWQKTWQNIPGWEYKLWTDKDVEDFPLINKEIYFNEKNYGARADILRLEILYRFGGVYIDTDFECIKPEMFNVLNSSYDYYAGLTPIDSEAVVINNAIIGAVPGHPILKECLQQAASFAASIEDFKLRTVSRGPGLLTVMTSKYMNKGFRDVIFPASFFYPLGCGQMRRKPYADLPITDETFDRVKKEVSKPETIAIHYWDGSWKRPAANIGKIKKKE